MPTNTYSYTVSGSSFFLSVFFFYNLFDSLFLSLFCVVVAVVVFDASTKFKVYVQIKSRGKNMDVVVYPLVLPFFSL